MIQFPSDSGRDGQGHVGGSQQAADELIAKNAREAARQQIARNHIMVQTLTWTLIGIVVCALVIVVTMTNAGGQP